MASNGQPQIDKPLTYRSVYSNHEQLRLFQSVPMDSGHAHLFVPQKVYRPQSGYVEEDGLEEPILFLSDDPANHGISLSDALHSRVRHLIGREEQVFQRRGPSVTIRLEVSRQ